MSLEDIDYVLFTQEEERAETALETYLEERNRKEGDMYGSYRYFVTGEEELTIIEDIRISGETIYNKIDYSDGWIEIRKNVAYEEVEDLLSSH